MKWIKVEDSRPEGSGILWVILVFVTGSIEIVYVPDLERYGLQVDFTHWMPLPEPPEDG